MESEEISKKYKTANVQFEGIASDILVDDENDYVHRELLKGLFYEADQLIAHRRMIPYDPDAIIVDVGANIGNHSIFYAKHTRGARVIPLEANPRAAALLENSILINRLSNRIDVSMLRIAISNAEGSAKINPTPSQNLGGTSINPIAEQSPRPGEIVVRRAPLDALLNGQKPSFIKIDVEGHEMMVLEGANETIDRFRPAIAVEVNWSAEKDFWKWVAEKDYTCVNYFHDYVGVKNYCLIPKS